MPMPGTDIKVTREAILDAYSEDDLRLVLRETMGVRLDNVVGGGPLATRVFELLEWAERQGREGELVKAVAVSRPRNGKLQEVYTRYGMAVPVKLVERAVGSGMESAVTVGTAGADGFEKTVRDHVPMLDPMAFREGIATVELRVCQITFRGVAQGTGFLVGPDAVLTNYHVMEAVITGRRPPGDVECVFDFKKLPDGSKSRTPVSLHATEWNIDSSPYSAGEKAGKPDQGTPTADELDYALVRLAEPMGAMPWAARAGGPARGWVPLPAAQPAWADRMGLLIAQHPNGWPMTLCIDTTAIDKSATPPLWTNANGTRVRYATNTEGGSSGSPVFDMGWNLIALHHYGDPDQGHPPGWNQGVPIALVRDRLTKRGKAALLGGNPT